MNLGDLLKKLTQGVYKDLTGNELSDADYSGVTAADVAAARNEGNKAVGSGWSNFWTSLGGTLFGTNLTGAEKEANEYTAAREDLAWQRQMLASNTQYQRAVADMSAAGINPMLAVSNGGAAVPSASVSGSVSHNSANLGSLLSPILGYITQSREIKLREKALDSEIDLNEANAVKARADADKTTEDTRGSKQQNDYFEQVKDLRAEGERLSNDLKAGQKRQIEVDIRKAEQDIKESIARADTEKAKQFELLTQSMLNNATVENMVQLRPFLQAELSARTEQEKAAAKVALVDAAYRQGLIDEGAIAASVRADNARASESEVNRRVKEYEQDLKDGTMAERAWKNGKIVDSQFFFLHSALIHLTDLIPIKL